MIHNIMQCDVCGSCLFDGVCIPCIIKEKAALRKENARLQAIVDKLPKTKDGKPAYPGGEYWWPDWRDWTVKAVSVHYLSTEEFYADKALAQAECDVKGATHAE